MMVVIPDWDGPGTGFTIIDAVAYVDTVEILLEFPLPRGLLSALRRSAAKRMTLRDATRPDRSDPSKLHVYGKIIALAQPLPTELRIVLDLCKTRYRTCRVDVAFDFHTLTGLEAGNGGKYLERHGWQKWRGKTRRCNDTENVVYWSANGDTARNIALYFDKPSRWNGQPCTHWEIRFTTADACRRAGLSDLNQLVSGIDALKLLKHEAKLQRLEPRRFSTLTEKAARRMKRSRRSLGKWTVDQIQNRIKGLIYAALQDESFTPDDATIHTVMAQAVHDRTPLVRKALVEVRKWEELAPSFRWLP